METQPTQAMRTYAAIGAVTGWAAVGLQLYLIIAHRVMSVFATVISFFSYFTILTNMLVALCFTILLLKLECRWRKFFSQPKVLTAIAVYISVVGIVYNIILWHLWAPQGLQFVVDELLHSVTPILFFVYWLVFVPKRELQWKDTFPWLVYPFVYLVYISTRGALSGLYPYPFIDVNHIAGFCQQHVPVCCFPVALPAICGHWKNQSQDFFLNYPN